MVFLQKNQDVIKKKLHVFLKKHFRAKVKNDVPILPDVQNYFFAPNYHIKKKNGEERIVILRRPAIFPKIHEQEIRIASQRGIGTYIAICDGEQEALIEDLLEICDEMGIGVIQHRGRSNFSILQPCVQDYPRDKILANRLLFFISSKLWIPERLMIREKLLSLKYQPLLVERVENHNPIESECIQWIDKADFFIGIVTPPFRPMVGKEILHAIKKKENKFKIYVKTDARSVTSTGRTKKSRERARKLSSLINTIQKNGAFTPYASEHDLKKRIADDVASLVTDRVRLSENKTD